MATWYVDAVNGSDSNAGTSWGAAFKTLNGCTSGKGVAAGDSVRVAKTPAPVRVQDSSGTNLNATFTNKSDTITLSAAATVNINTCDSAWMADNGSTVSTTATNREGTNAATITVTTTAQLRGHAASATSNLSGYTGISFWIKSSVTQSASTIRIDLCSDTAGAVPVHSFTITDPLSTTFRAIYFNNGSALSSSIQSIALVTLSGIAAGTITIDNVIACNSLNLTSLISKESAEVTTISTEPWWPIRSINGTTIKLDYGTNAVAATTVRGYSGTTETVAVYCRASHRVTTQGQSVPVNGTSALPINISGGWDTGSNTQTGETWWDFADSAGSCLSINAAAVHVYTKLHPWRGANALTTSGAGIAGSGSNITLATAGASAVAVNATHTGQTMTVTVLQAVGIGGTGVQFQSSAALIINSCRVMGNANSGISLGANTAFTHSYAELNGTIICSNTAANGVDLFMNNVLAAGSFGGNATITCSDNAGAGFSPRQGPGLVFLPNSNISVTATNNTTYGLNAAAGARVLLSAFTSSGNVSGGISAGNNAQVIITSASISEATKVTINDSAAPTGTSVLIEKYGGTTGDSRAYYVTGSVTTSTSTRHTASGISWVLTPSSLATSSYPLIHPLQPVAVDNTATTFGVYVNRSNSAHVAGLQYFGGDLIGEAANKQATDAGTFNNWNQVTLSLTGTEPTGAFTPYIFAYGNTGAVYFDDASVT